MSAVYEATESQAEAATAIAVAAGVLAECGICGEVWNHQGGDPVDAYKLGNSLISANSPLTRCYGGDRRAMTDSIGPAIERAGEFCECRQRMNKDD